MATKLQSSGIYKKSSSTISFSGSAFSPFASAKDEELEAERPNKIHEPIDPKWWEVRFSAITNGRQCDSNSGDILERTST